MRTRIKPHGAIKISKNQPKANIPSLIMKELSVAVDDKIPYVVDAHTVLLFNPAVKPEKVLAGLEALTAHLRARIVEVKDTE